MQNKTKYTITVNECMDNLWRRKKKVIVPIILFVWTLSVVCSVIMYLAHYVIIFQTFILVLWNWCKYSLDSMTLINTILIEVAFNKAYKKLKRLRSSIDDQLESQNLPKWVRRDRVSFFWLCTSCTLSHQSGWLLKNP